MIFIYCILTSYVERFLFTFTTCNATSQCVHKFRLGAESCFLHFPIRKPSSTLKSIVTKSQTIQCRKMNLMDFRSYVNMYCPSVPSLFFPSIRFFLLLSQKSFVFSFHRFTIDISLNQYIWEKNAKRVFFCGRDKIDRKV